MTATFAVEAVAILVIPSAPEDGDVIEIDSLEVNACFEEVETTVTTTPSGVTTTRATTTQFTTEATTVTTVATTFTPQVPLGECRSASTPCPAMGEPIRMHCPSPWTVNAINASPSIFPLQRPQSQ